MFEHRHRSMEELQQEIHESIAFQGFAIRHVFPSPGKPGFTYTVGLHRPDTERPELFVSGLKPLTANFWMLDLGFQMMGPPPRAAQRRMAAAQGVPVASLHFPVGGRKFLPGVRHTGLADNGLSTCFGEVDQRYYEDYFGQAIVFHDSPSFPVLQLVWPDKQGYFPFEENVDQHLKAMQALLFDPQKYLPLKNEE